MVSIQAAQVPVDPDQQSAAGKTVALQSREPNTVDSLVVPPSPGPRLTREAAFCSAEALMRIPGKFFRNSWEKPLEAAPDSYTPRHDGLFVRHFG